MAKPIRSASGIAVVAVMSKPHRCPHIAMTGNICVYCPGGPDSGKHNVSITNQPMIHVICTFPFPPFRFRLHG